MTGIDQCLGTLRLARLTVSVAYSIETPLALIGPAHFSISVSTNFCRYSGELRSPATRSAPISCIRVFTAGGVFVVGGAGGGFLLSAAGVSFGGEEGQHFGASEFGNPFSCPGACSCGPPAGQRRGAIPSDARDRLTHLALNLGNRDRGVGARVIDPAGDQILHRRGGPAIGHVGDIDSDGRIQQHTSKMARRTRSARAVLHACL